MATSHQIELFSISKDQIIKSSLVDEFTSTSVYKAKPYLADVSVREF